MIENVLQRLTGKRGCLELARVSEKSGEILFPSIPQIVHKYSCTENLTSHLSDLF